MSVVTGAVEEVQMGVNVQAGAVEEVQMGVNVQAGTVEEVQMGVNVQAGAVEEVQTGVTEEVQMGVNVQAGAVEEEEEQTGAEGVSGDQGQAAGVQLTDQPVEMLLIDEGGEEVMESDSDSDCGSVADSQSLSGDLYTLEDVTSFLDETFGESVKVADFFPDPEKFLKSVLMLQKAVGVDLLDERKRALYRAEDCTREDELLQGLPQLSQRDRPTLDANVSLDRWLLWRGAVLSQSSAQSVTAAVGMRLRTPRRRSDGFSQAVSGCCEEHTAAGRGVLPAFNVSSSAKLNQRTRSEVFLLPPSPPCKLSDGHTGSPRTRH
ncbi:hypothetical protein D4764_17G0006680 [Takifugu flavidus]|uniref:Uncharacterized protein n=1 Tax=Takifugu flavidus TaxID=433684 RepID=A0A5C6NW31_9TELE|nr:hypothetical protein D4764_17G0006680 [Takifugu flavidus]